MARVVCGMLMTVAMSAFALGYCSSTAQYGEPVAAAEAQGIYGACIGTSPFPGTGCLVPCATGGSGLSCVQTFSQPLGTSSLQTLPCGCGGTYDTVVFITCGGGT